MEIILLLLFCLISYTLGVRRVYNNHKDKIKKGMHPYINETDDLEFSNEPVNSVEFDELFYELRKCHHNTVHTNDIYEAVVARHLLENCIIIRKDKVQ